MEDNMKKLLASTAIVAAMAMPVTAQSDSNSNQSYEQASQQMQTAGVKASNLMGQRVYMKRSDSGDTASNDDENVANATNNSEGISEVPDNWQMVGDVDDILMTQEGEVRALIVDAGGFLGMDENAKQVDLSNVRFIKDSDDEGEYFVVFNGDRSKFESTKRYDQATAENQGMQRASEREDMQQTRQSEEADLANLTTEELLGAAVYGSNDNWVGEISELALAEDGQIDAVIVDVGGFLGIGEKPVALNMDQITINRVDGDELRGYVSSTEEELENMDSYSGSDM
jgi:sporulation protein YlmC with PRC-barrel domain